MERHEEMWKYVENEHGELSTRELFVTLTALEYADETMLEKVCEWLKTKAHKFTNNEYDMYGGETKTECLVIDFDTIEEMINNLKKDLGNNEDN